jgi:hypothetical protein
VNYIIFLIFDKFTPTLAADIDPIVIATNVETEWVANTNPAACAAGIPNKVIQRHRQLPKGQKNEK